nr:MAG TPA: hypothetical protein [Microviridae sp.]
MSTVPSDTKYHAVSLQRTTKITPVNSDAQ